MPFLPIAFHHIAESVLIMGAHVEEMFHRHDTYSGFQSIVIAVGKRKCRVTEIRLLAIGNNEFAGR